MPTENEGIEKGKLFIQAEDGEMKEIGKVESVEFAEENYLQSKLGDFDQQAFETTYSGEIIVTLTKNEKRSLMKKIGLETLTRKRFKKLLMGCGMQRNDAEVVAQAFNENGIRYTPLGIQKIIETINEEAEKEEKENEKI